MAKSIKDMIFNDSKKNQKMIMKALGGDNASPEILARFEAFKNELGSDNFVEFPKLKVVITNSFVCGYTYGIGYTFDIVELSTVKNAYRSNLVFGEYDFAEFSLAVETDASIHYISRILKNKKGYDTFNEVISEIQKRATSWSRGV
ncbi:MAG: hypothetical protein MJ166_10325 [Clostridia bacterium]|nr:hypothetical protein [Clostridia bacterium]